MKRDVIVSIFVLLQLSVYSSGGTFLEVPSAKFKSISETLSKAKKGDTIWVNEGTYRENIIIGSGITVISKTLYKAVINGGGLKHTVVLGNQSSISGFTITNGMVGIYSEGKDNTITKCKIFNNMQTGIVCVGTLPNIEDNIIVFNKGSGIQGWDVRSTMYSINHNTIAYNNNHGISIGGKSEIIIENNIISFNEKLGLKVDPDVKARLVKNNFYYNGDLLPSLPEDNYSFDPLFTDSKIMNFILLSDSKCINMATDNTNLGARFIY